jgi:hypothetical protein
VRTCSRGREESRGARLFLRATYAALGFATAAALGGCPGGAVLEDPERFRQYDAGLPAVAGASGASGGGGAGQGGVAGAVATGGAGMGSAGWTWNCSEVPLAGGTTSALNRNCVNGCHNSLIKAAGLDLTDPSTIGAQMVDKPPTFADFGCQASGESYRECTREEMIAKGCPTDALLIDSNDFDASWVVKKLTGGQGECGDAMPLAPGNSAAHWDAEGRRKQCYLEFFRSLAVPQ